MNFVFRADASNRMGTGHVMRCLTLAEALRDRGAHTRFVCRAHHGNLVDLLRRRAMPVTVLPRPETATNEMYTEDYGSFLGVTKEVDTRQIIEALHGHTPDWLIIDHYGIDEGWERILRPHVGKLMVIEDFANRHHDCDLLLNQNYTNGGKDQYRGLVPGNCHILLGPGFALLKPEYTAYRQALRSRDWDVRRVLVFFGGSDRRNMTALTLEALSASEFSDLEVDVVVGASNSHRIHLERKALSRPLTNLYGPRQHLADLMSSVDLAIGASGATIWERMCLGLPSVVITTSENQKPAAEALKKANLIQYVGHYADINEKMLSQKLRQLIHNPECLREMCVRNQLQVDGYGTSRVTEVICPTNVTALRLRPAISDDCILYYNWVNDPAVRKSAMNSEPISWQTHSEWFRNKMQDEHAFLFVLEAAGLPIGQIRFDRTGDETWIDYSLDSIVRGRGWATRLVALGMDLIRASEPVHFCAEVKPDNKVSRLIFLRLGFVEEENAGKSILFRCSQINKLAERLHSRPSAAVASAGLLQGHSRKKDTAVK